MELRGLVLFGLCLLAVSQSSDARHSKHKRDINDDDMFANDEASYGEQNDEYEKYEATTPTQTRQPVNRTQAKIVTQPHGYEAKLGDDVRMECNVEPENGTVIQWWRGQDLLFLNRIKMIQDSRFSLVSDSKDLMIQDLTEQDRGVYKCEVVQENVSSVEHTLVVLVPPKIIRLTATNNGKVREGQDLYLTCDVAGVPPPQIVWSRTVDNGNKRLGEDEGEFSANTVRIPRVRHTHAGRYYCYAFSNLGSSQAEVAVDVAAKPHVHVHKTIVNSAINVQAILECSTSRFENNPHIRWYKDGVLIEDSSSSYVVSTRGSASNLTVTPKTDADFGTFTCEALNDIGSHNRSISLVQRPVVEQLTADGGILLWTVHSHQPLISLSVQARPIDSNTWTKYEVALPETYSHKYDLKYDLAEHLSPGKYEVYIMVQNENSWSENVDPLIIDIDIQPEYIQHASVFRGSNGHSVRPSSILSTILMYLLVRM